MRQSAAMRKHVEKILNHQRDILAAPAVQGVQGALDNLAAAERDPARREALPGEMENLEKAANKWLKPYPNASWRENIEVLLVALALAMGIRTFFLQPFKIPTGSMQPTLFGVTSANLIENKDFHIPSGFAALKDWFRGTSYIHVIAKNDGDFQGAEKPVRFLIFNLKQTLTIGGQAHTIWFPPDVGEVPLEWRAGLQYHPTFHKGDDVIKLQVNAGDHPFVDRVTYNFRVPRRGEIIVFETKGIQGLRQDQFYIKRMVAMGGEKVQIGDDRHLIINGQRLDESTPHFQKVYSFDQSKPPQESHYSGHVNEKIAEQFQPPGQSQLAPLFPDGTSIPYQVRDDHYMVMGDNTMNSLDSRSWGDFPAKNVIGKSFFVYWPLTSRFGWGYRN
jgi:signal peptidase I